MTPPSLPHSLLRTAPILRYHVQAASGNTSGAASTQVLVQAGLPAPRHAAPWEGTLRPPQEQRQGQGQQHSDDVVEASEISACVPWHQTLDTRDSFAVGRCCPHVLDAPIIAPLNPLSCFPQLMMQSSMPHGGSDDESGCIT